MKENTMIDTTRNGLASDGMLAVPQPAAEGVDFSQLIDRNPDDPTSPTEQ